MAKHPTLTKGDSVLVTHDSRLGSTAEVALFIGEVLSGEGVKADVKEVSDVVDPGVYDLVIVGSAIRYDRWLQGAIDFVTAHRQSLSSVPVAYFFTCLTLARRTPETERKASVYADQISRLLPEVRPTTVGQFAGVLDLARAPWPTRLLLRALSIATGVKEGDYRDWQYIRAWALGLVAQT